VSKQIKAHDDWMRVNRVVPDDISIHPLRSQFTEARHAFRRIALALVAGFVLALFTGRMLLGNGRRGVLLGVVMLVSVQSAFLWMALLKISLDAITLGGLALGTGFFGGSAILLFGRAHQPADGRAILKNPLIIAALTLLAALLPLLFVRGGIDEAFRGLIPVWLLAGFVSVLFSLLLVPAFDRGNPAQAADADTSTEKFPAHQPRRWRRDTTMLFLTAFILTALLLAALVIKRNEVSPLNDAGAITLSLQGEDRERLAVFAEDLARRLRAMPSLRNVSHGAQPSQEEFQLRMDDSRARERGIDITEAGRALAIALTGISAGSFSDAEHRYDIRLRLPPDESANDIAMGRVLLLGELEHRPAVYLRDVARIEHASAPARLLRRNGIPAVEIMASPAQGTSPGQAWDGMRKVLDDYPLPAGYRLTYPDHGDFPETYRDWNPALFGMALLFVFVALAAWQRSLRAAFAVAVVAAIVVTGTGLVLWLLDVSLSPSVELGGLILLGIVAGQAATGVASLAQSGDQDAQQSMKPPYSSGHPFHMLMIQTLVAVAGMTPLLFISDAASRLHPVMLTMETGLLLSLPVILFVVPNYMCSVFDPGRKAKNKT
jgi:multidrug efflux pump subunit AcrB